MEFVEDTGILNEGDHSKTGRNQSIKLEEYRAGGNIHSVTLFDFTVNSALQVAKGRSQFVGPAFAQWSGYSELQVATAELVDDLSTSRPLMVCSAHGFDWYGSCDAVSSDTVKLPSTKSVRIVQVGHPSRDKSLAATAGKVNGIAKELVSQ